MTSHSSLTLYAIEDALLGLLTAREELIETDRLIESADNLSPAERGEAIAENEAEIQQVEKALAEYVAREIGKVDGIHHYLTHATVVAKEARAEAEAMRNRAVRIEANVARLKALCCDVMAAAGKKRIDGTAGRYLLRKGNGGLAPLVVQEDILPENFRDVTVRVPKQWWRELLASLPPEEMPGESTIVTLVDESANARIRECLKYMEIPGAHLGERGEHLEAK